MIIRRVWPGWDHLRTGRGSAGAGGVPVPCGGRGAGGSPIGEVAERYGTSRQSLDAWRKRFRAEGMPGLVDRSRRPRTSPGRVPPEVEALICGLRREHPR